MTETRKKSKRKLIIQAAIKVYAQKGFSNTKIIDIAQAASIGKGTIYEYFSSKEEIFNEAFFYFENQMDQEILKRSHEAKCPREQLIVFIEACFDIYLQFSDFMEVLFDFWAYGIQNRLNNIDLKSMYEKYRQSIIDVIEAGIEAGVFKPVNSFMTASAILAAIDGLSLQWLVDKDNFPLLETGRSLTQTLMKGLEL